MELFEVGATKLGPGCPAFIIAEVAQAHDGSLGMAHAYIDAAAEAGVDAIKFQTHFAEAESTQDEPWRVKFSRQDRTRFEYWRRMSFTPEQWAGLAEHAREKGIVFLSSAFSLEAVEMLERLGMPAWKVASGEVRSRFLIDAMAATGKPLLVSTGMCSWADIDAIVGDLKSRGNPLALFQCTSRYPAGLEDVGLNVMHEFHRRYGVPAGLSDHSGNLDVLLAAMFRGAHLIEAHITFDRRMFGPDVSSSLTVEEFKRLVQAREVARVLDAHPVDKDAACAQLEPMRRLFMRSIAPRKDLRAGEVLTRELVTLKKPGTGIPETDLPLVLGRRLRRDVPFDRLLVMDDLES